MKSESYINIDGENVGLDIITLKDRNDFVMNCRRLLDEAYTEIYVNYDTSQRGEYDT